MLAKAFSPAAARDPLVLTQPVTKPEIAVLLGPRSRAMAALQLWQLTPAWSWASRWQKKSSAL